MEKVIEIMKKLDEAFAQAGVGCRPFFRSIEADKDGVYLRFSGCVNLEISKDQMKEIKQWC